MPFPREAGAFSYKTDITFAINIFFTGIMYFMHLPTLRGNFSVSLPLCARLIGKKPSGYGTRVEFSSLAVSEPPSCHLIRAGGLPGGLQGLKLLGGGASQVSQRVLDQCAACSLDLCLHCCLGDRAE